MAEQQDAERQRIQAFVDRFRAKASKARQAQSRLKMLQRMEPVAPIVEDKAVRFDFPQPSQLPPPLIAMDGVNVGYDPATPILTDLDRRIDQDDRIALLGANGNGKTTLARLIAGRLAPLKGHITKPSDLRVGYFAQDQADELDLSETPFAHMARVMPNKQPTKLRTHLGRFGFSGDKADTPVGKLSGGEKARLLFALMTRNAPHMLVLDEPTNHLDIEARQALIEALNAFEGAVILVSHDPHLVELVADRLWLVSDGGVRSWDDDLAAYKKFLLDARRAERTRNREAAEATRADGETASRKDKRKAAAETRAATADLRKRVRQAEQTLERLNGEKAKVEALLADPKVYEGPADQIQRLHKALAQLDGKIEKAEEDWLAAEEALESAH
jgi:ATP-binding cassette subfamily F protein 3